MIEKSAAAQPYITTNEPLAQALCALDADWFVDSDGEVIPCYNIYSASILSGIDTARRAAKQPPLGLAARPLEEAVRIAYHAGHKGKVEYWFKSTERQQAIVTGWGNQSGTIEALERGEAANPADTRPLSFDVEDAAKLLCQYAKAAHDFAGDRSKGKPPLWKAKWPQIEIDEVSVSGSPDAEGGTRVRGKFIRRSVKV